MSEKLGPIPYPMVGQQEGPLAKYQRQLDPLAKLTDPLWQTPARPPLAPIQPPMPAPSLGFGRPQTPASPEMYQAQVPPQGGRPGVQTPPQSGLPLAAAPGPVATTPGPARPTMFGQPMPTSTQEAFADPSWRSTPWRTQSAPTAGGGLEAFSPFEQYRRGSVAARLRAASALAPEVPTYEELQQQGRLDEPRAWSAPDEPPASVPGSLRGNSIEPIRSRDVDRVSTRIPSEAAQKRAGINAHTVNTSSVGFPAYKQATEAYAKNAQLIKTHYPGFQDLRTDDPDVIHKRFVRHIADNLKWLYNRMLVDPNWGPERVARAKEWYHGANRIVHRWAGQYGLTPMQVGAAIASMSPQKDWFQNVDLTKRLFDIHHLHMGARGPTPEQMQRMHDWGDQYITGLEAKHAKAMAKRSAEEGTEPLSETEIEENSPAVIARLRELSQKFRTTPYHQLDNNYERAVFARMFDEGNNHRMYRVVSPEGEFGDYVLNPTKEIRNKKGQLLRTEGGDPRKIAWGSFKEIEKAMTAMHDASPETISRVLGSKHKIRSFHNDMVAPDSTFGDITGDTHHIAASLFRPLGSSAMEVGHGLGTGGGKNVEGVSKGIPAAASNATIGTQGLYPLYHEGARIAANELSEQHKTHILGREVQSVTWEGIRSLFTPAMRRDTSFMKQVANIWHNRGGWRGKSQEERLEAIFKLAGGLRKPTWDGGEDYGGDEA